MRGSCIVVTSNPKGKDEEGIVATGQTFYPGMIVQRDASVALKSGKHTYKLYDRSADGEQPAGAFWVVTERLLTMVGKTYADSYGAGERCPLYSPMAGEELNLMLGDVAGTGDDHTAGEILMVDDGTGELVATTGSPETEVAQLLETITDPIADTLAWCQWTGH